MQVLLDECLPAVLRLELRDHDVRSVEYMQWKGRENGELLNLMLQHGFEVFITIDQSVRFQQNVRGSGIAVIELAADSNRIESLLPLVPRIQQALDRIRPGELVTIAA